MVLGHDILTSDRTEDIKISENVSFESMLLSPKILKGLKEAGFYVPSPIQLHGIPLGKCGFDLLLEAKSGTGKTAVFTVIALEKLNLSKGLQTLMLAPTREIASQICEVIKTIGANFQGLSVEVVMGGLPFAEDVEKFKKTVHIVVGSPGRLYHLINQKHIDVSCVRLMVLDEADKLLEKSFLPDINKIFSLLPNLKQMIMSSATYPENMKEIIKKYVLNAHHICPDSNSVLLGIEQYVVVIPSHVNIVKQTKNRYVQLHEILSKKKFKQCLVFCNYQVRVGEVHKMLNKDKWPADQLHGKQQQTDRLEALKILQEYQCRILVSTDLAARGIDASNVDLVINFEIPYDWQTYLHRIGRAGRFGSYGNAISILCEGDEEKKFRKLLGSINIPFNLKNLWSKEPFPLDKTKTVEDSHFKEENKTEPTKKVTQSGIKDADDELRKILSFDSTQLNKETNDIPTFESLCKSFEQVNKDSKIDGIESFSDLCSSFQNHEIKGNEHIDRKPVEVNKLIIPCTMFDGNIVLQSFENHKKATSFTLDNINKKNKGSIENKKKTCNSKSSKPSYDKESENVIIHNTENDYTDSDKESSENQSQKSKYDGSKPNENLKYYQSETSHDDVCPPSTSKCSQYKICTKSKANREAKKNENLRLRFGNVDSVSNARKVFTTTKMIESKNDYDESVSDAYQSEHDHAGGAVSPEYNDSEKALLAANLPTAFGKAKQNTIQSKTNRYFSSNTQNIKCSQNQLLFKNNVKQKTDSVYESSESEKTEKESVSHNLLGGKKSVGHSLKHTHTIPNGNKTVFTKRNVKQEAEFYESSDSGKCEESVFLTHRGKKSFHVENKKLLNKSNVKQRADSVYEKSEESVLLSHVGKKSSRVHNLNAKGSKTVVTKRNVKQRINSVSESSDSEETKEESVYESSNSDKSEEESVLLYYGGKKPSKGHRLHRKKNKRADFESSDDEKVYKSYKNRPKTTKKRVSNDNGENNYILHHANSVKEKQREFNRWYQELQANMRILETFFYIAELRRLNKNYT